MSICNSCISGCCYKYIISITGYDILKIKNKCMLEFKHFLEIMPITEEEKIDYHQKHAALFKFTDDNCEHFHIFLLKKAPSKLYPGVPKCIFLREIAEENFNIKTGEGSISKCSIYSARPNTCIIYPADFDKDNRLAIVSNPKATKVETPIYYKACPREITSNDFSHSKEDIIDALVQRRYELTFFKMMAEDWNANPKSQQEFFTFMEETYLQRVFSEADFR